MDIFWNLATSAPMLWLDVTLILIAVAIGCFPLAKYLPVIGPYVPVARLVAVLLSLLTVFLLGFRLADQRQEARALRAELALKDADVENANQAAADATKRAALIEAQANDQHDKDQVYIAALKSNPACGFDPGVDDSGVRPSTGRLRGRLFRRPAAPAPAPAGAPDASAARPGP